MLRFGSFCCVLAAFVCLLLYPLTHINNVRTASGPSDSDVYLPPAPPAPAGHPDSAEARSLLNRLPARFERNEGQADRSIAFIARAYGHQLLLSCNEAVLAPASPERRAVHMRVAGSHRCTAHGEGPLSTTTNYFIGNDRSKWRTGVKSFEKARFDNVYSGIDLVYYGTGEHLEYDFIVSPGGSPDAIRLSFDGVDSVSVDASGELVLKAGDAELRQHAPVMYQELNGERRTIAGRYAKIGDHSVAFEIATYDTTAPLVIDPVLVYSSLFGTLDDDKTDDVVVDGAGNVFLLGESQTTTTYPNGASFTWDVFVLKLNALGTAVLWTTYLGGSDWDNGSSIAVDSTGNVYVAGTTRSPNFPSVAGSYRYGALDQEGMFALKLSANGTSLQYVARMAARPYVLSGPQIAVDGTGNLYLAHTSHLYNLLPTLNAAQPSCGRDSTGTCTIDAFVWKLNGAGTGLAYATYLGGSGQDEVGGIAVDASGAVYVAGLTTSPNFPVVAPTQATRRGATDCFLSKLGPTGSALLFSTYLGGTSGTWCTAVAVDPTGQVLVGGATSSRDIPGGPPYTGAIDFLGIGFVSLFGPVPSSPLFTRYAERVEDVAFDSAGNVHIAGTSQATSLLPDLRAFPTGLAGPANTRNLFVRRYSRSGDLGHSMSVGGQRGAWGARMAIRADGVVWLAGSTASTNFPRIASIYSPSEGTLGAHSDAALLRFVYALSVTSTSPTVIPVEGESVTLRGLNFAPGATVRISGGPPLAADVINPTQLSFNAPSGTVGSNDITVANPDDESTIVPAGLQYATCAVNWNVSRVNFHSSGGAGALDLRHSVEQCPWTITGGAVVDPSASPPRIGGRDAEFHGRREYRIFTLCGGRHPWPARHHRAERSRCGATRHWRLIR